MSFDVERLYALLPAIQRRRDFEQGSPLKALLAVIADQVSVLEEDLAQRYDDHFIETCSPWVVPYIGDLVGVTPLFDGGRIEQPDTAGTLFADLTGPGFVPQVALRGRADVANTIHLRRRKATLPMLEELARLVTGWAAHTVEFFELLTWSQCVRNHLRLDSLQTPDLRALEPLDRLDGPFDAVSHSVDVRAIVQFEGHHNIKNIGFFLWRLQSFEIDRVSARPVSGNDFGYSVSPLGNPAPLFSRFRPERDQVGLAAEPHLPAPIRPAAFYADLTGYQALPLPRPGHTELYGLFGGAASATMPDAPGASLLIVRDGVAVPPEQVVCMNLGAWSQPEPSRVGVDVRRGRLAFGPGFEPALGVEVYFHYGFSAALGGGGYRREPWRVRASLADLVIVVDQSGTTAGSVTSLGLALNQWLGAGKPNTIIVIADSASYAETISIEPADGRFLVIEAADRQRPHLLLTGPLELKGQHPSAALTLSGLLVEGSVHVTGALGRLRLLHTTLVPGRALNEDGTPSSSDPSLIVDAGPSGTLNEALRVELAFSITGPLRVPEHAQSVYVLDSIVDGLGGSAISGSAVIDAPGPSSWIERSTLIGEVFVSALALASEVIFDQKVRAVRRQEGCVRFSFVPVGSSTPRRFRCQPELEINEQIAASPTELTQPEKDAIAAQVSGWLVPSYTSTRYGQPAYAQLHLSCPKQISEGAEDGSELGVFCHLKQPQRLDNLRFRLREYLPFGLEPGFIFVT